MLKEATLENHQALEQILVTRLKAIRSTKQYLTIIPLFYTYICGLEKKIEIYVGQERFGDYAQRHKVSLSVADIKQLAVCPG